MRFFVARFTIIDHKEKVVAVLLVLTHCMVSGPFILFCKVASG
jgi:hypothetical protein